MRRILEPNELDDSFASFDDDDDDDGFDGDLDFWTWIDES